MWQGIAVFGLLSIIHLCEAKLETFVIGLKNPYMPKYSYLNRKEHLWSAVLAGAWLACAILATLYFKCYWIIPALILNRRIFFDYGLIVFEDWDREEYGGNDWWVQKVFIPIFGINGRKKELIIELLIVIASIIKVVWN